MKVPHVFIDTSIFIGNNYDYNSTGFRQIKSLVKQEKLLVYLTRVTVGEVERHIAKDVSTAQEAFDGFRGKSAVRILKNVSGPPLYNIFHGFDSEQTKQELLRQFHTFLDEAKANVLELTDLSVEEVFEKYFAGIPPFANDKKPSEFPDAFSLAAIERWCKTSSGKMYVVSTDSDWQQVCDINPSLKYAQSLSEFLDLLSQGQKLADEVSQLFKTHQDAILEKIRENVEPLSLNYEPYGDVQYVSVNSVRIVKHFLIEVDDAKAVFDVISEVSYSANVLYKNNALMITIGITGAREEIEYGSTNVRAEVTITFDQKKREWIAIDSVDVKHDSIYLFPDEEPEDFARKFTLAQKAFSKHALTISELLGGTAWVLGNTPETVIQRFDEIKGSLPMRVILDLQTLSMLNQATGGLSFSGANSIKDFVKRMTKPREDDRGHSFTPGLNAWSRHAFEAAKNFDHITNRRFLSNADIFDRSAINQMIELTKHLHHSSLSGHSFSRDLLLNINPKRSDESQTDGLSRISVEVLRNTDVYGRDDDTIEPKDEGDPAETPPFEFGDFPRTVTLSLGRTKPLQTHHKLRKPTTNQWEEWGRGIERTIRYLSAAEIKEELGDRDVDKDSIVFTQTYSEWTASERLYNQILLEVAGFEVGDDDNFPKEQFRSLSPHLVKDIRFEIKSNVIKRLYRCYCELKRQSSIGDEQTVLQYIDLNSESFQVRHVLRTPTAEESDEFRTTILKADFAKDDGNREVVDLKLDLSVASTFYDRLLNRIENATVVSRAFEDATRDSFLRAINPVYKLRILEPLFDVNAWYFTIDDFTIP